MANIKFSHAASGIALSFSVAYASVSASFSQLAYATDPNVGRIQLEYNIMDTYRIADNAIPVDDQLEFFVVDKVDDENVTVTDTPAFSPNVLLTDSVTMSDSSFRSFVSNVDFDLSDADVDPDPVTVSEADAKTFNKANIPDTVTIADSPALNPQLAKTDSISASESLGPFDVGLGKTETVTVSEADAKQFTFGGFTDSVSSSDSPAKTFTHGGFTDSVSGSDSPVLSPQLAKTESISASESLGPFTVSLGKTDSVTVTESISTELTLGDLFSVYPDNVVISDGDIGGFIINATEPYTGVIGAPGYVGQVIVNDDKITTPDNTNSGLVYEFVYTETMIGGHQVNETPIV